LITRKQADIAKISQTRQHLLLVFNIKYNFIYKELGVEGDLFIGARADKAGRGDGHLCQGFQHQCYWAGHMNRLLKLDIHIVKEAWQGDCNGSR